MGVDSTFEIHESIHNSSSIEAILLTTVLPLKNSRGKISFSFSDQIGLLSGKTNQDIHGVGGEDMLRQWIVTYHQCQNNIIWWFYSFAWHKLKNKLICASTCICHRSSLTLGSPRHLICILELAVAREAEIPKYISHICQVIRLCAPQLPPPLPCV